jgi:molybdopterin molybdotransferase
MSEFLHLLSPPDALARLLKALDPDPLIEVIAANDSLGRVTAERVFAPHPMPEFPRSTVDGFAVRAADTYGASEGLPAYLDLTAEIEMGRPAEMQLGSAQAATIHTGGMIPPNADAVVMVEYTQPASESLIEILRPVAVGENVLRIGEDVSKGDQVLDAGVKLRPAEIGGLMAIGKTQIAVYKRPRVAILSSGDEVIAPDARPQLGQVRDINSYSLRHLIGEHGGEPVNYGIIPDEAEAFARSAETALADNDMVVFTAGSSVSVRDLTAQTIDALGEPGTLVHGVNVKPGKPTILAVCDGKPVIGLPGNPVSALVIARIFVAPLIDLLQGMTRRRPAPQIMARLTLNLSSQSGREDWIGVKITETPDGWQAEPVFGKSNLIFTLAQADGLLRIPPDATGISAGELAEVYLL